MFINFSEIHQYNSPLKNITAFFKIIFCPLFSTIRQTDKNTNTPLSQSDKMYIGLVRNRDSVYFSLFVHIMLLYIS